MKFPKHLTLHINHNDHESSYEKIEDYLKDRHIKPEDILPEDREQIIRTNSIWEVQWYPRTPISFYYVAAATLERCLEIINSQEWE